MERILEEEANFEIKLQCFLNKSSTLTDSSFHLDKTRSQKEIVQTEDHQLNNQKQTENTEQKSIPTTDILEKARDLFGGNIRED